MKSRAKVDANAFLSDLGRWADQSQRNLQRVVEEAAQEIRNDAVRRTPVDTGLLRAAWKVRPTVRTPNGAWTEVSNSTPYAKAVEFGSRPHVIRLRKKSVLMNRKTGQVFGKQVNHPGNRPKPMLRPAVDAVLPRMRDKVRKALG